MSQYTEVDRHPYERQSHRWQELLCESIRHVKMETLNVYHVCQLTSS